MWKPRATSSSRPTTRFYSFNFLKSKQDHETDAQSPQHKSSVRQRYGTLLCSLLLTSLLAFVLGGALALAGYYTPMLTPLNATAAPNNNSRSEIVLSAQIKAHERLLNLRYMKIAGLAFLVIGFVMLSVVVLLPFFCINKDNVILPKMLTEQKIITPTLPPSLTAKSSQGILTKHLIQPKPPKAKKLLKKKSYTKGFLSPEMDRRTILVTSSPECSPKFKRESSSAAGRLSTTSQSSTSSASDK